MKKMKLVVGIALGSLVAAFLQDPRLIVLLVVPVLIMVISISFEQLLLCFWKIFFCFLVYIVLIVHLCVNYLF
jgi:hypothetical protein